jgi:glucokinase
MAVLGDDIGGTKIATACVNAQVEVSRFRSVATLASQGLSTSLGQVWRAIELALTPETEAIGICAPGPLDASLGIVLNPPNLPGWRDVPLAGLANEKFGLPVRIENDCNAAGLAEALYGAGSGYSHVFYTALGTGIGSGIVIDGKIFHGSHGAGAEAGHMSIDYRSSILCGCGTPGCIEALASGRAFDDAADEDFDELSVRLGAWLGAVMSILDPGIIVVGGGVAQIGDPLLGRLRAVAPRWTVNPYAAQIPIVPAKFGAESGVIGAAALCMQTTGMKLLD